MQTAEYHRPYIAIWIEDARRQPHGPASPCGWNRKNGIATCAVGGAGAAGNWRCPSTECPAPPAKPGSYLPSSGRLPCSPAITRSMSRRCARWVGVSTCASPSTGPDSACRTVRRASRTRPDYLHPGTRRATMKLSRTTPALLVLLLISPLTSAHKRWFMPTDFVLSEAETVTVDFTASIISSSSTKGMPLAGVSVPSPRGRHCRCCNRRKAHGAAVSTSRSARPARIEYRSAVSPCISCPTRCRRKRAASRSRSNLAGLKAAIPPEATEIAFAEAHSRDQDLRHPGQRNRARRARRLRRSAPGTAGYTPTRCTRMNPPGLHLPWTANRCRDLAVSIAAGAVVTGIRRELRELRN